MDGKQEGNEGGVEDEVHVTEDEEDEDEECGHLLVDKMLVDLRRVFARLDVVLLSWKLKVSIQY